MKQQPKNSEATGKNNRNNRKSEARRIDRNKIRTRKMQQGRKLSKNLRRTFKKWQKYGPKSWRNATTLPSPNRGSLHPDGAEASGPSKKKLTSQPGERITELRMKGLLGRIKKNGKSESRPNYPIPSSLRLQMPEYECMYMGSPYLEYAYPHG